MRKIQPFVATNLCLSVLLKSPKNLIIFYCFWVIQAMRIPAAFRFEILINSFNTFNFRCAIQAYGHVHFICLCVWKNADLHSHFRTVSSLFVIWFLGYSIVVLCVVFFVYFFNKNRFLLSVISKIHEFFVLKFIGIRYRCRFFPHCANFSSPDGVHAHK